MEDSLQPMDSVTFDRRWRMAQVRLTGPASAHLAVPCATRRSEGATSSSKKSCATTHRNLRIHACAAGPRRRILTARLRAALGASCWVQGMSRS